MVYHNFISNYSNTMNRYGSRVNAYNTNTSPYFNYSTLTGARNDDLKNKYIEMLRSQEPDSKPAEREKQSMLQRIINMANIGNYTSAGFAMGFVDDEINPLQGAAQGFRAGLAGFNIFDKKGYEDWEYDYSGVLEKAGWEADSFGGRFARGGVGLALDIALDPLTYVSGGTSALIKGSGKKSIAKVGKGAKKIASVEDVIKAMGMVDDTLDNTKYISEILDMTKGVGMNIDTATDIVKGSNLAKHLGDGLDVADEATKFMKQYNKIMGIGDNVGKTISLSHLPLGRKIFGDMADKHIEVISRETLEAIGDKTLAPIYAEVRDGILGGKLGKLFNNKSTMYKLARDNPAEFFNDIRQVAMSKGNNAVRLGRKEIIEKNADFFDKLTPSEKNEMLDVMENPSKWNKINKEVKFANMDEIKRTQKKIVKSEEEVRSSLKKAKRNRAYNEKRVKEIFTDVSDQQEALELLDRQRWADLKSIDASKIKSKELLDEYIVTTKDYGLEIEKQLKSTVDIDKSIDKFKQYKELKKQADIDLEYRDVLRRANSDTTFDIRLDPNPNQKGKQRTLESFMKDYIAKEEPFKDLSRGTVKTYREKLEKYGYVGYTKGKVKSADLFEARVPGWDRVTDQFGNIRFYPPDDVIKSSGLFSEVVYDSLPDVSTDKMSFIDDLSEYLFGKKGMLSDKMHDGTVDKVIDWIDTGKTQEFIINEMFRDRRNYNGVAADIYSHIGREVGYHRWEEDFTKPMDELISLFEKQGNKYIDDQQSKVAQLMGMKVKRDGYLRIFKDVHTQDDLNKIMKEIGDEKWTRLYDDVVDTFIRDGLGKLPQDQAMRNDFNVWDYMEYAKKGEIPRAHHKTKVAEDFSFGTKAREMTADYFAEHHWGKQKSNLGIDGKLNFAKGRYGGNTIEARQETFKKFIASGENLVKNTDDEISKLKKLSDMQGAKATEDGVKQAASTLKKIEPLKAKKTKYLEKIQYYKTALQDSNITNHGMELNYFNQYVDDMGVVISDILKRDNIEFGMLEAIDQRRLIERAYKAVDGQRDFFFRQQPADIGKAYTKALDEAKKLKKPNTLEKLQKDLAKVYKKRDNTKAILEATDFNVNTIKRLDDIPNYEVLYDEFVVKHRDLYKLRQDLSSGKINTNMSTIELTKKPVEQIISESNKIDADYIDAVKSTNLKYEANMKNLEVNIDKLTRKYNDSLSRVDKYVAGIGEYSKHIKEIDDALASLESLETYAQVRMGMDTSVFHEKLIGIMLDPDVDISPNARNAANILRQELFTFSKSEVGMGKMSEEAFEAMKMEYLPHILTDEGKKFMLKDETIKKGIKGFGNDFGYGREFNPFAKTESIKEIILDGEVIQNPTVKQINAYFKEELLGNNLLSEDIADIYLQRATKNLDLMYDNAYMENMLEVFGHDYINGPVREGFTTSMNYGMLKKQNQQIVSSHTTIDISETISSWISEEAIYQKAVIYANDEIAMLPTFTKEALEIKHKELINDFMTEQIDDYMTSVLTKEVRDKMYAENLKRYYDKTGVGELVDDVALPISPLNDDQIRGMRDTTNSLQERFYGYIESKYNGFKDLKKSKMPDDVFDVNIAAKDLQNLIDDPKAHSIDVARAKRELKNIERFNDIKQPQIKQVNASILERSNMTRQLQIQRDNNGLLNMYDKFLHFIKLNQTTVLPTFHIRNLFSNQFNNWLEIGMDAYDPKFKLQTIDAMRGHGLDEVMQIVGSDGKKSAIKWKDIISQAKEYGVLDDGMFATELGSAAGSEGLLKKILPGKFDPTDTKNFIPYDKGSKIGSFVEGNDRLIHFASQIKRGMGFEEAAESVNKFLFDYSELTFFEQSVMKRIMPYYTWLRKNSALQMEQFITNPNKYRNMFKVVGGIENTVAEDERLRDGDRSGFLDDWIQLPFSFTNSMGQKEPLMLNPNLPYQDINRIPDITDPKGSLQDLLAQTSPILKLPLELATNKNIFFDNKIHDPEREDKIDKETGEVIEKAPSKLGDYTRHVANQFGVVPQIAGFFEKDGVDLGLHAVKNLTGISATAYNVQGYKWIQSQKEDSGPNLVGKFKDAVSSASDGLANLLYEGRPIRPDERTDSLRPISQEKFDSLSDEEKLKYVPPTKDEGMYYNQKAVELEKQSMASSGIASKFVWTLLEKMGEGDRNQPFEMGSVSSVIDGDTVDVNVNGEIKRVRLLLIDTPEVSHDEDVPSMPYAEEAKDYVSNALINEDVRLFFDGEVEDAYGRTLAYIETSGGRDINQEVLEQGLGVYGYDMNPPYQRGNRYTMSEQQAKQTNTGVWSENNYAKPQLNTRFQQNYNELSTEFGRNEWMVKKRKEMDAKRDALNRMLGR